MVTPTSEDNERPAWFVGASYGGNDDQTERFIRDGIWENGYDDRYLDVVRSMEPGDRIAIKSTYVRSNPDGLPFDNHGHNVSVMAIKATGVITANVGDGRRVRVDWTPVDPAREWYFYTYRSTIWEVRPDEWSKEQLIGFTFGNQDQDIHSFRNDPYWRARFGDTDTYTISNIIADGCFLPHPTLETILRRLQTKQNIILQGPPGTGKTWLAKRLAYALIGHKDDSKVRPFQFHPNVSYEDFVRGWRPDGDGDGHGRLTLVDSPFLQLCDAAQQDPDGKHVIVIEEINRGNPASIFGELLTLLESDKRSPDDALALAYPRATGERFHIPPNVYVIGTMNTADRSIAMIDLALRRRFAFFELEPQLNDAWREWVAEECGLPEEFLAGVERRLTALNDQIATAPSLGRQFRIGHSYVTPASGTAIDDPAEWFAEVVETEIGPLLYEYWFDEAEKADAAKAALLSGLV